MPERNLVPTVLVIDDDAALGAMVGRIVARRGWRVIEAEDGPQASQQVQRSPPDAVLLDLHLGEESGMSLLSRLVRRLPGVPIVMLTADDGVDQVVKALQAGAWDYLMKPVDADHMLATLDNALTKAALRRDEAASDASPEAAGRWGMIGRSLVMRSMYREIERVADSSVTVLLRGESGTGKELVARALHDASPRRDGPFIALNCAAIPETLQEAELFGFEKGAFTGAEQRRIGRFEQADGGTILLDEVGELAPPLQAAMLRVLQERRFHRLGGRDEVEVDVRVIAATHRDLAEDAADGRFRQDLFYRLSVFELDVPPLRRRVGDVALLAQHFLQEGTEEEESGPMLGDAARKLLEQHDWPGNVRELRNAMARARVVAAGSVITPSDLPPRLRDSVMRGVTDPDSSRSPPGRGAPSGGLDPSSARPSIPPADDGPPGLRPMERLERAAILEALDETRGNVSEVIRRLGIPRTTLYRKLSRYGIGR